MDLNIISSAVEKTKQMNNIIHDYANSMLDQSKTCTFLGISYRSGVGDLRESSALELALNLNKQNYKLEIVDPFVDPNEVRNFFDITDSDKTSKIQAVLAVKHAKFDLKYLSQFQLIIDINSCLSVKERSVLRNKGVKIKQFGDFS
jgi:UDP-N-acetyl-D-mannosaminuronate dehydrogenase